MALLRQIGNLTDVETIRRSLCFEIFVKKRNFNFAEQEMYIRLFIAQRAALIFKYHFNSIPLLYFILERKRDRVRERKKVKNGKKKFNML